MMRLIEGNPAQELAAVAAMIGRQCWRPRSQPVERAANAEASTAQDMRVDHRRADVRMPQQLLDGPNIVARLEEVGRE